MLCDGDVGRRARYRTWGARLAALIVAAVVSFAPMSLGRVWADPVELTEEDFRRIGNQGFGDRSNSYAWSMASYRGKVYIGTNRDFLCLARATYGSRGGGDEVPIECDPDLISMDLRGRIYTYDSRTNEIALVYISPMVSVLLSDGSRVDIALDNGYRTMDVFREPDGTEALYVGSFATTAVPGPPPRILRTTDGKRFTELSGEAAGNPEYSSYRSLTVFKDRLYIIAIDPSGGGTVLLEASDPVSEGFRPVSEPGFGSDVEAFQLAVFRGYLYVGAFTQAGFELLKTDATGPPPYVFKKILTNGAYRGAKNQSVVGMSVFRDHLYVGTGTYFGSLPSISDYKGATAELLRVKADDSWEIVAGEERDTPDGYKRSVTGMQGGFDNPFTSYMWRMVVHDGVLYVGTFDTSVMIQYAENIDQERLLTQIDSHEYPLAEPIFDRVGVDEIAEILSALEGGFDLWSTTDGLSWKLVSRTGFGDQFSYGVRTFQSTPFGLFVGTANPFYGFRLHLGQPPGTDSDGDGFADADDNCPLTWNLNQADLDGDGIGDACDDDRDGDCMPDVEDAAPRVADGDGIDTDDDGIPDGCDLDDDNDDVPDCQDNCPLTANTAQADEDGDGRGDACESGGIDDAGGTPGDGDDGTGAQQSIPIPRVCGAVGMASLTGILLAMVFLRLQSSGRRGPIRPRNR